MINIQVTDYLTIIYFYNFDQIEGFGKIVKMLKLTLKS